MPAHDLGTKWGAWRTHYTADEMRERFLIDLRETKNITHSCENLTVKSSTVSAWRRAHEDFDNTVKEMIRVRQAEDAEPVFTGGMPHPDRYCKPARWLARYQQTRSYRDACIFVGVRAHTVQEWRNAENPELYDKDFDELMRSEEIMDLWDIEEIAVTEARGRPAVLSPDGETVLIKPTRPDLGSAKFLLERRLTSKYGPPVKEQKVRHQHELTWFSEGGKSQAEATTKMLLESTRPQGDVSPQVTPAFVEVAAHQIEVEIEDEEDSDVH